MSTWTISVLISLGLLLSGEQWNAMSPQEKEQFQSIIIEHDIISSVYEIVPSGASICLPVEKIA